MCLRTNFPKFKTAEEDIMCWKILVTIRTAKDNVTITPFRHEIVPQEILEGKRPLAPNEEQTEKLHVELNDRVRDFEDRGVDISDFWTYVEGGVIHTYTDEVSLSTMGHELRYHAYTIGYKEFTGVIPNEYPERPINDCPTHHFIYSVSLWKCVIPKGTEYLEGDSDFIKAYASASIVLKEKVAEFTRNPGNGFLTQDLIDGCIKKYFKEE